VYSELQLIGSFRKKSATIAPYYYLINYLTSHFSLSTNF